MWHDTSAEEKWSVREWRRKHFTSLHVIIAHMLCILIPLHSWASWLLKWSLTPNFSLSLFWTCKGLASLLQSMKSGCKSSSSAEIAEHVSTPNVVCHLGETSPHILKCTSKTDWLGRAQTSLVDYFQCIFPQHSKDFKTWQPITEKCIPSDGKI